MNVDIDKLLQRRQALQNERSSWLAHWKEINKYLLPRSGRFDDTRTNDGRKKNTSVLDSTGTWSLRVLTAGMMAGMTSPARPWFRLTLDDTDLAESANVKEWLHTLSELMRKIFYKSNTYRALHSLYGELGAYGTAATILQDDFDTVVHHHPLTVGEFSIATDGKGRINTLVRDCKMTVEQMIRTFGKDACSSTVQNLYTSNKLYAWVDVYHIIEPRENRDLSMKDAANMAFRSVYLENTREKGYLREGGFKRFPALCPRWETFGSDIYGSCPGMDAIGDLKQLQHEQQRKALGIDYQTKPPLQIPSALKNAEHNVLPGGKSYYDQNNPQGGIRSAFEVTLDLRHLLDDIEDVRFRIKQCFYADLFLLLATDTRSNITAREVAERHEEKLLMLGPVLERLENELLSPLIDVTFDKIVAAGIMPPPPPELEGRDIKIEFISMLAQAQRAVGLNGVDRLIATVGALGDVQSKSGQTPTVGDKFNYDQAVDVYSDMLGVDPDLIVADDRVAFIRKERNAAMAREQAAQAIPTAADTAKTLSETNTEDKNALTDVMRMFSGYNA